MKQRMSRATVVVLMLRPESPQHVRDNKGAASPILQLRFHHHVTRVENQLRASSRRAERV
ncbi:hypothetical protein EYF80_035391 [Liparis tanakae]|uniref:Uncharacterized protein n=1 Tax=Liparis tanakae TaxID=230148 RepID=A0A4Z2GNJ3_9TELE|nr:hypothetical protein EYF80_035391 [Liparis tanakae]